MVRQQQANSYLYDNTGTLMKPQPSQLVNWLQGENVPGVELFSERKTPQLLGGSWGEKEVVGY